MGLDTPKRPEVKVKVPKFTKVEVGPKYPDDLRQIKAKQKSAKKTLKKLPGGKKGEKKEFVLKGLTPEQRKRQAELMKKYASFGGEKAGKEEVYEVKSLTSKEKKRQEKLMAELVPDLEEIESEEARKRELDKAMAELERDFQKWEKEKEISEKPKKRGGAS